MTPNPSEYRIRRDHRAEQDAADRPWWRRVWLTLLAWIGGAR